MIGDGRFFNEAGIEISAAVVMEGCRYSKENAQDEGTGRLPEYKKTRPCPGDRLSSAGIRFL